MNLPDLSALKNLDMEYKQITDEVSVHFNCEWDDQVHDSYRYYVKDVSECAETVHKINTRSEMIVKEVDELKIDELVKRAEELCREADAV